MLCSFDREGTMPYVLVTRTSIRPKDVDASLWGVIISIKVDTAAIRQYLSNINFRLEAVGAQNEKIVANISSLQTEMQVYI